MGDIIPFQPPEAGTPPRAEQTPAQNTGSGSTTEWDGTTLDGAATQLDWWADSIGRSILPTYMGTNIEDNLTGGNGISPFGTFPAAIEMSQRQIGHYERAKDVVTTVAERLRQAAETLREVKEKYETTEAANTLSAAAFDRLFAAEGPATMGSFSYDDPGTPTGGV
ncbi:hypothetical protein ACIA8K_18805 [Catenuloplanes sp. NPDC051500]|uniref:hypothetical protein n=1 Tax=Catenuloplanes sp. NPDC051500 TaxID=3363959 RepID=UPI003799ACBF